MQLRNIKAAANALLLSFRTSEHGKNVITWPCQQLTATMRHKKEEEYFSGLQMDFSAKLLLRQQQQLDLAPLKRL